MMRSAGWGRHGGLVVGPSYEGRYRSYVGDGKALGSCGDLGDVDALTWPDPVGVA